MTSVYDFEFQRLDGGTQSLSGYRGQVLLLVNTASRCSFTPQYQELQALWSRHRACGLVVIGFPCNQFGGQEPGDAAQIQQFCSLDHGVDFPMAAKIEVKGPGAHPLWAWLQRRRRGLLGAPIRWNFTKFLVARDGRVLSRHAPFTRPMRLEKAIEQALG